MRALRYCFLRFAEDPNTGSFILTTLSTDRYINAYEHQPQEREDVPKILCVEFQGFQLIASKHLRRIWSHMNWEETIPPSEGDINEIAYDDEEMSVEKPDKSSLRKKRIATNMWIWIGRISTKSFSQSSRLWGG